MRLQVIGGFLGAGKTTLVRAAARRLSARGERVAIVTNDQGHALVDTSLCAREDALVAEIAGGCFCCRYPELEGALEAARSAGASVVLAEAVGSCTDLVATVLAPLEARAPGRLSLAPLAVVVDPYRVPELLLPQGTDVGDDVAYLFRKQLEEAEVILVSRADLAPPDVRASLAAVRPGATVLEVSGLDGRGVEGWLSARPSEPSQPLELDYDRYAAAEARLGWYNARVVVTGAAHDPGAFLARFFEGLGDAPVAHVKLTSSAPAGAHATLARPASTPRIDLGPLARSLARSEWLLNARVALAPEALEALVRRALEDAARPASIAVSELECFQPARPVPTHRLALRVLAEPSACAPLWPPAP